MIISFVFNLAVYKLLIWKLNWDHYRQVNAVGYSCVLFGWMTIAVLLQPDAKFDIFGIGIPMIVVPFMSLIFTQLLIPQASFVVILIFKF
jgi:membrane associated rhomboid family serine protease